MAEKFEGESKSQKTPGEHVGTLSDLGLSLLDHGVARPYNATIGLIAPRIDLSDSYDQTSMAAKAGSFGGTVFDMAVLSKVSAAGVTRTLGWGAERGLISGSLAESSTLSSTLSLTTAGGLYGGVFTPGSATDRLKNAGIDSATFATMGFTAGALGRFTALGEAGSRSLMRDVAVGGLSGLPAGVLNAEATSLLNGRGPASGQDLASSALHYAAFGGFMSAGGRALTDVAKSRSWLTENSSQGRPVSERVGTSEASPEVAAPVRKFNIPEAGNIELGRMLRETAPADQAALVQQVIASRPQVPVGSWMRLIAKEDMATFLRATHEMYPQTALGNAGYLIGTRNLRPPTADSPPIDFRAWERALDLVKKETNM